MNSYTLRPGWSMSTCSDGALHLVDEDREIVVRSPTGTSSLADALAQVSPPPAPLLGVLEDLERRGAVIEYDPERDRDGRASRQLEYFDAFTNDARLLQHRLESCRLLVIGLGGTGSEFLRHMVAAGVRSYVLVDQDVVEESNFNRQTLYDYSDLGRPKVLAAERWVRVRLQNADCEVWQEPVRADDRFASLLTVNRPSLVFVAVDEPIGIDRDLAAVMDRLGMPYLVAGVGIRHGRVLAACSAPDPAVPVDTTRASLGTTNAMVAARAAHRAIEFLTDMRFPFEVEVEVEDE